MAWFHYFRFKSALRKPFNLQTLEIPCLQHSLNSNTQAIKAAFSVPFSCIIKLPVWMLPKYQGHAGRHSRRIAVKEKERRREQVGFG